MSASVFDLPLLQEARSRKLQEVLREVQCFGRRAKEPSDRIAMAELEHELVQLRARWQQQGLLPQSPNSQPQEAGV